MAESFATSTTIPVIKRVGSKSIKIISLDTTFSIYSPQTFGDISAYTLVGSGSPQSGTLGFWIYCDTTSLNTIAIKIGSSSSDYAEVAGVKTYTDTFDLQGGWNYFVFKLKNATTTGTPDWTAVDYTRIEFTSIGLPIIYVDYFTIGEGDEIGANGFGDRRTVYIEEAVAL